MPNPPDQENFPAPQEEGSSSYPPNSQTPPPGSSDLPYGRANPIPRPSKSGAPHAAPVPLPPSRSPLASDSTKGAPSSAASPSGTGAQASGAAPKAGPGGTPKAPSPALSERARGALAHGKEAMAKATGQGAPTSRPSALQRGADGLRQKFGGAHATPHPTADRGSKNEQGSKATTQAAKRIAAKGVTAGLTALGVPPALAKRLAPLLVAAVSVTLVFAMLAVTAVVFGTIPALTAIPYALETAPGQPIPPPYLQAYQNAAAHYGIPWTILAAIGRVETDHGRTSPYDTVDYGHPVDRDPQRPSSHATQSAPTAAQQAPPTAAQIIAFATPYATPTTTSFTNPSFLQYVFAHFGIALPATAAAQAASGAPVASAAQAVPGDLVVLPPTTAPVLGLEVAPGKMLLVTAPNTPPVTQPIPPTATFISELSANPQLGARAPVATSTPTAVLPDPAQQAGASSCATPSPAGLVAVYPCTAPAIGTRPGEGQGPFLLLPSTPGISQINPQNVQQSAYLLAALIKHAETQVEATTQLSPYNSYSGADQFWSAVVATLPIANPTGVLPQCGLPSGGALGTTPPIAVEIQSIWQCQLQLAPGLAVAVPKSGGSHVFVTLPQSTAQATLLREALATSWAFSQWGQAACNPTAPLAGVFPLTQATAARYGDPNRCDQTANITAAANAVIAGEQTPIALRSNAQGPYEPLLGGWAAMPWALGSPAALQSFEQHGPLTSFVPSTTCTLVLNSWLGTLASVPASPFIGLTGQPSPSAQASITASIGAVPYPRNNPACGVSPAQSQTWDTSVATAATALAQQVADAQPPVAVAAPVTTTTTLAPVTSTAPGTTTPTTTPPTTTAPVAASPTTTPPKEAALEGIAAYYTARSTVAAASTAPVPGTTSVIGRLSTTGIALNFPSPPPIPAPAYATSIAQQVVPYAIYYGGLLPGDPRAGTPPYSVTNQVATTLNVVAAPIALGPYAVPPKGLVAFGACGAASNTGFTDLPIATADFAALCAAAQQQGVTLTITSAHRTTGGPSAQRGLAINVDTTDPLTSGWLQEVTGCYTPSSQSYTANPTPMTDAAYAQLAQTPVAPGAPAPSGLCTSQEVPVTRAQTYGLVFSRCGPPGPTQVVADLLCTGTWPNSTQVRQNWHLVVGQPIVIAGGLPAAFNPASCGPLPAVVATDPQSAAIATYEVFRCAATQAGLATQPAAPRANGVGPPVFGNLAEEIASEAVVVGYCESGYSYSALTSNNSGGYGGVFQMGNSEAASFVPGGVANKFNPPDNIVGAARYFLSQVHTPPWYGWGPWATVDTNFTNYGGTGANAQVLYPALPRFPSTYGPYAGAYTPGPLPAWSINPYSQTPNGSCSNPWNGKPWN